MRGRLERIVRPRLYVLNELWAGVPAIMHAIYVCDGYVRQLLFRDSVEAADVDPVHFADRCLVSDAKDPDSAMPTEIVMVFL
jgi:hypothetical protein